MDKEKLVNQSIDYIMQNLNEDLSLDHIAAQLYISKYYFSRIFKEKTGESVYAFIKRCKVDQSAIDIKLDPLKAITDIGLDYGYSASNYSSVFKKHHNTSPTVFRQSISTHSISVPFSPDKIINFKTFEAYAEHIEVQKLNDFFVLYERFIGNYIDLEKNWLLFLDKYKSFFNENTILIERFFHDPTITNTDQCIYDICMTVEHDCTLSNVMWIKGGQWIVYHYAGEIKDIFEELQGVFSIWFSKSNYKMIQPYALNIYRSINWNNHSVVMDLYIPVAVKQEFRSK